jgi:hypothetical protein
MAVRRSPTMRRRRRARPMARKLTRRQRAKRDPNNGDAGRKARKWIKRGLLAADPVIIKAVTDTMPAGVWFKRHGIILMGTNKFLPRDIGTAVPAATLTLADVLKAVAAVKAVAVQPVDGFYHIIPAAPPLAGISVRLVERAVVHNSCP